MTTIRPEADLPPSYFDNYGKFYNPNVINHGTYQSYPNYITSPNSSLPVSYIENSEMRINQPPKKIKTTKKTAKCCIPCLNTPAKIGIFVVAVAILTLVLFAVVVVLLIQAICEFL